MNEPHVIYEGKRLYRVKISATWGGRTSDVVLANDAEDAMIAIGRKFPLCAVGEAEEVPALEAHQILIGYLEERKRWSK